MSGNGKGSNKTISFEYHNSKVLESLHYLSPNNYVLLDSKPLFMCPKGGNVIVNY